jgi:GNAT superfamily N-acetyltransferase
MMATELISIPNAPAIPGLAFRGFRGEGDFPGMVAAFNASEAADGVERVVTVEDIANDYAHLVNCDLTHDFMLVEVNGETIGYARVEWYKDEAGNTLYSHLAFLRPKWRRRSIGAAFLKWAQTRLREVSASLSHPGPRFFQAFVSDTSHGAEALLINDGYTAVRHEFLMVRPTLDDIPGFLLPAGLEVRPVLPEHYRAIWDASEEALRDHWGFAPSTEDDYQRWLNDKVIFTPELWKIAWDVEMNQVAGQVRGFINHEENRQFNRQRGWAEFISVRRLWRKRGLARALIALTLQEFKKRGMTESVLGVDTQNLSGALRVYEDCGFRPAQRSSMYRKPLA